MKEYTLFLTFFSPFKNNIPITVPNIQNMPDLNKTLTILDFMTQEFDAVRIIGGEPFVTPLFNEILDFAVERYKKITIESLGAGDVFRAGYNIKRHISDGADIDIIFQMIDMDPSINDKVVGYGAWETAISAASLLQSTFDITPKIAMYIGSHSTHRYSLLTKLGFKLVLRRAYGMNVTERSVSAMFKLSTHEGVEVEDCVLSAISNGTSCSMPKYVLDVEGNIYLSRYKLDEPLGNIFGLTMDDLHDIVSNAYQLIQGATLGGKCARCAYAEICNGGDFHFWKSTDGAADPACPIREEAVADLVEEGEEVEEAPPETEEYPSEDDFIDELEG